MRCLPLLALGCLLLVSVGLEAQDAQPAPRVGQAGQWQQQQWSNPMGQSLGWLSMSQIQKELEIIPEQQERLDKIRTEIGAKMQEMYKSIGTGGDQAERTKKYYEMSKELGEETEKKVKAVLLPHQIKRIQQISLQMKMQSAGYGYASTLTGDDVLGGLGLSDAQKELLKEKEEEVRKEMQQKTMEFYKKLNEESREKLLAVLTPAQRKQLYDLIGEKFEWQWQQPQSGGAVRVIEKK